MITNTNWQPYLDGSKFSAGALFQIAPYRRGSQDRLAFLQELCAGKRVIHFGFADHLPLIKKKIEKGEWLHSRLIEVAEVCVGLDNDANAVPYVTEEIGIPNCFVFDLFTSALPDEVAKKNWDIVLLGEIIEHVDDPVSFLKSLRQIFSPIATQLIVTAPNALSLENVYYSLRDREFINTDHRYWFTPYTLLKVGHRADLKATKVSMCGSIEGRALLYRALVDRVPMLRETILAEFALRDTAVNEMR